MRYLLLLILLITTPRLSAQMYWQQPIVNYTRQQYHAGNQNWMIDQHPCGWMYFANNNGLLEFDGTYWNLYPMPNDVMLRSVLVGNDGRIYVGGQREFGFFKPNRLGGLSYTSLAGPVLKSHSLNIWKVMAYRGNIYFQGDQMLYRYSRGHLKAIDCNGIAYANVVNNRIYFSNSFGLYYLRNDKPVFIPGSQILANSYTCALLPLQGKMLIVTNDHLYSYDGKAITTALPFLNPYIDGHTLTCAAICGNTLAIGTSDNGVLLVNLVTRQVRNLNIDNGLQNTSVISLKFDHERNLWLGLDNGIDYVSLNSALLFLSSKLMSIGAGYCSLWNGNKLFLGTNQGVYTSTQSALLKSQVKLRPLPGLRGLTHCLYAFDGKVFCGGRRFLAISDGQHTTLCPQRGVWHIQAIGTKKDNAILLGTYWGLEVMRKNNGKWIRTNAIDGIKISAKTMFVEPESNIVWVANKSDGLWRLTLNLGLTRVLRKKKYNNHLLPQGQNVYITRLGRTTVVASYHGLFRYDEQADCLRPFTALVSRLGGHGHAYTYIAQDGKGRLWYVCDGTLKCVPANQSKGRNVLSFLSGNMISDFEDVNFAHPNAVITGTEDGFVMLDMAKTACASPKATLQIRRLYTTSDGDSLAFGRSYLSSDEQPELDYHHNSIRIAWGACNFNRAHDVTYSYRLKGLTNHWSNYTAATTKEYTRLHEGEYTFEVRMEQANGRPPIIASLTFRVLPPWYRSWWAYTIYGLLLIAAIYYLYKRYKESRARLIRQKDEELSRQKSIFEEDINKKNKQIDDLEAEKLRNELQHKSDELMKTTLNVVRKNEMLQTIQKEAEKLFDNIGKDTLPNLRRGMLRLISQIDTNIEHDSDLDNLRVSFDAVHKDFFKKLDSRFPQLTHKDKMLCAYIRMDLLSKEIAPLLNISIRGVEISRYRLRKKMGLDTNVNLSEFLQKL